MRYHLTRVSTNAKTGNIPTVVISSESCPPDCPYQGDGCYAELGPVGMHWNRVTKGDRGVPFKEFIGELLTLPHKALWRYAVAGDLPGKGNRINRKEVEALVAANTALMGRGFTYTHKPPHKWNNGKIIAGANAGGFTINLSSNNLAHADELHALGIGPVVTIVPSEGPTEPLVRPARKVEYREPKTGKMKMVLRWGDTVTPGGLPVLQCPAEYRSEIQCVNCGNGKPWCQRVNRKFIVGFTTHGPRKAKADKIARNLPVLAA